MNIVEQATRNEASLHVPSGVARKASHRRKNLTPNPYSNVYLHIRSSHTSGRGSISCSERRKGKHNVLEEGNCAEIFRGTTHCCRLAGTVTENTTCFDAPAREKSSSEGRTGSATSMWVTPDSFNRCTSNATNECGAKTREAKGLASQRPMGVQGHRTKDLDEGASDSLRS